jgi:Ser/Thr protein kinase RdoA (MazF antagonist)
MIETLTLRALAAYGLPYTRLLPMQKGYRNESHPVELPGGMHVNLIIYKSEPDILTRIQAANAVADYLDGEGMPVRHTIDARILRMHSGLRIKYAALYAYLPGATIPWEAYTMAHLKLLGATMGSMHHRLQGMASTALLPHVEDEYAALITRMQQYFADPQVAKAMSAKLGVQVDTSIFDELLRVVASCKALPGRQALHMDFVRGNILFMGTGEALRISGILDFEKTAVGHPLFDIARTLAFLLVDCKHKDAAKVRKYFIISGYNKHGNESFKVNAHNERLLDKLVGLFLLYDFYKFLRHNPYESLHENEHYIRTLELLRKLAKVEQ